jgi:hypothetical protein
MKKIARAWNKKEIDFIISNYVDNGVLYCMNYLKRSKDSIKHKAIQLGLNLKSKRYEKDIFAKVVETSRSYSDVVRKIGLNDGHGNRKTVIKYIKLYNVDISHFDFKGDELKVKKRLDLKEILIENSTYNNTSFLKERLYKENLKKRECEDCGQGEEWRGKKMSLILDHINGIHNDNRLENLRILCPNCNSTLETHCGKNRK